MKKAKKFVSLLLITLMLFSMLSLGAFTANGGTILVLDDDSVDEVIVDTSGDYQYSVSDDGTAEITDYIGSDTDIVIPDTIDDYTVTSLGGNAFSHKNITSVIIPDSVTNIDKAVFFKCESLADVTIGNSVTNIGSNAFFGCLSLENIVIPDSVVKIGSFAFANCSSLTDIIIPNSVTIIENSAFARCTNLKSISISAGVTKMSYKVFYNCLSLESITVDDDNQYYSSVDGNLYNKDKTELIQYAIGKKETSFEIPDSVTSIGDNAFEKCANLTNVTIPDSVTSIGEDAFSGCTGLLSVTIPSSVNYISFCAFMDCTNLTSVTISDGLTTVGGYAFYNCTSLKSVTIPSSVTTISTCAFGLYSAGDDLFEDSTVEDFTIYGYTNSVSEKYAKNNELNFVSIGEVEPTPDVDETDPTPDDDSDFSYVLLDDGTAEINSYTGSDTEVVIPSNINGYTVTSIGEDTFFRLESVTSITIPDTVTNLSAYSFYGSGIKEITIPNSVTSIDDLAFCECENLTKVTIPESVTDLDTYAFLDCPNLENISVDSNNPNYSSLDGSLYNKDQTLLIQYATGKEDDTFEIPNTVTSIDNCAISYCENLVTVVIPDSVTNISYGAFKESVSLTSVTIPDSVTTLGSCAFYGCTGLKEVSLPNSIDTLSSSVFALCSSLENITIPDSVTTMETYALVYTGLKSITIPKSVTQIDEFSFGYVYDSNLYEDVIMEDFIIYGYSGSCAETYANDCGFTFVSLGEAEPTVLKGDANQDGKVDINDVTYIQKYLASFSGYDCEVAVCDVNNDYSISIKDCTKMQRYLSGITSTLS